jgi:hypothetical protein
VPNPRIDARNAIARGFVSGMMVDDQYALMEKHRDLYLDNVHFNSEGSNIMGVQVADMVLRALNEPVPTEHNRDRRQPIVRADQPQRRMMGKHTSGSGGHSASSR